MVSGYRPRTIEPFGKSSRLDGWDEVLAEDEGSGRGMMERRVVFHALPKISIVDVDINAKTHFVASSASCTSYRILSCELHLMIVARIQSLSAPSSSPPVLGTFVVGTLNATFRPG